ncbi:hypothetical protein [Streptococcus thermophilus]|uniref:hypothetical protein n=1 Tax=Streptococcus thermophilus TaxID=1308 RepID=UPI001F1213A0|nr:hypothetical protein [Streptococcus thermophilus]
MTLNKLNLILLNTGESSATCISSPSQRRSEFPSLDLALIIEKNGFTLCPYLIRELGVDFALMS